MIQRSQEPRTRDASVAPIATPFLVGVVGGRGRTGATTVAVNAAVALAQWGQRVVLVDADLHGDRELETLCGATAHDESFLDVLHGRRGVHEVLQRGPGGILVLPNRGAAAERSFVEDENVDRLMTQLRGLGRYVESVVIDLGDAWKLQPTRLACEVDGLLLVTTPDPVAIRDSYAALKWLLPKRANPWVGVVVTKARDWAEAEDVASRLSACARKFLNRDVAFAGAALHDERAFEPSERRAPLVLGRPESPAAQGIQQLAGVLASLAEGQPLAPTLDAGPLGGPPAPAAA